MVLDPERIKKRLSLHSRNLISTSEAAHALLVDMLSGDCSDPGLPQQLSELPIEIRNRLWNLLREIESLDYRWKPFLIGPIDRDPDSGFADPVKLKQLCALLQIP